MLPTQADALVALSQRLSDGNFVRWPAAELRIYLAEALRTWQAYTQVYRQRGVFPLASTEAFYDLPTVLPTLRGHTITNQDLLTRLEYALLEPPTGGATWTGSAQFDLPDLEQAITASRDRFLVETGAVVTRQILSISPAPSGRVALPEDTLAIRRLAWRDTVGLVWPLYRDDSWATDHYRPDYPQAPTRPPRVFATSVTPPTVVQLAPPPLDTGALDLTSVQRGADLPSASTVLLGVPDDFAWVVVWGALALLLGRDGLAHDPARVAYCEQRWQHGLAQARIASVVLTARINEQVCRIDALSAADQFSPLWQSVPGTPHTLLTAGQTVLAAWPPPGVPPNPGGVWSVTLDVVANWPVPVDDSDPLGVTAEAYSAVLDYAQHLACFKDGPQALEQSAPLLERFFREAGVSTTLQQAEQPARKPLLQQTAADTHAQPRRLTPAPEELTTT